MMKDKIITQKDSVLESIDKCKNLQPTEKLFYKDLLESSCECTNGLTPEEKLQKTTESVFFLTTLVILARCTQPPTIRENLYHTIRDCKWAICIITGILATLLLFRPELSCLISKLIM